MMCEGRNKVVDEILPGDPTDHFPEHLLKTVGFIDPKFQRRFQWAAIGLRGQTGSHMGVEYRSWTSPDDPDACAMVFKCKTGVIAAAIDVVPTGFKVGFSGFSETKKKGKRKLSISAKEAFTAFARSFDPKVVNEMP